LGLSGFNGDGALKGCAYAWLRGSGRLQTAEDWSLLMATGGLERRQAQLGINGRWWWVNGGWGWPSPSQSRK
jgi:hypothetical protein